MSNGNKFLRLLQMNSLNLNEFKSKEGLDRARHRFIELVWYMMKIIFFLSGLPWPSKVKKSISRLFGVKLGSGEKI